MSRTKNKTTKQLDGLPINEKRKITRRGAAYNEETKPFYGVAFRWASLFDTFRDIELFRKKGFKGRTRWSSEKEFLADFRQRNNELLNELMHAIDNQDASYFKKLSVAIDNLWPAPVDPIRTRLISWFFNMKGEQKQFLTLRQLVNLFKKTGTIVDADHLRRVCKDVGIKLKDVKTGRPRKSDNSSGSKS